MSSTIQVKRGTREQLDTAAVKRQLLEGEPILVTDEGRLVIATSVSTYTDLAKLSESSGGGGSWGSITGVLSNQTDLQAALDLKASDGANSDITSLSGITGGVSTVDYIDFDTTVTPTRQTGRLWWDNTDGNKTLNLGMEGSNATLQIGEELYFRVKASSAITEGQVVMFTGTVGASGGLTAAPATGLTAETANYLMGVATENIALNSWGYITQFGLVRNINTTGGAEAWVDGTILYYNPAVAGGLTKNVPSAPNAKVQVCAVIHAATNGSVFVRPTFGGKLGQFEGDVQVTSAVNGNALMHDGSKWINRALTSSDVGLGNVPNENPITFSRTFMMMGA